MARVKGSFQLGSNYEVGVRRPLDSRQLVTKISDLTEEATWIKYDNGDGTYYNNAYNGMIVAVSENASIYVLKDRSNITSLKNGWIKVGEIDTISDQIAALDAIINGKSAVEENGVIIEPAVIGLVKKVEDTESIICRIDKEIADIKSVGAEANVINAITVNGAEVSVENKVAKIEIKEFELKVATKETIGGVKSSELENEISVADNGSMSVNSLNVSKLTQTSGHSIVLNCGNAIR